MLQTKLWIILLFNSVAIIYLAAFGVHGEKENWNQKGTSVDALYLFSQYPVYQPAFSERFMLVTH